MFQLGFEFQLFLTARFRRIVGGLLHRGLLLWREAIPNLLGEGKVVQIDEMARQDNLLGDFVELRVLVGRQRVILAVDGTGLQRCVNFSEGHWQRVGSQGLAKELPGIGSRHAQFHTRKVGRGFDFIFGAQVKLAAAEIHD